VLVVVNPQHTLKLDDVTVRLTRLRALDDQTYRRSGTIVYTVPLRVHNDTDRPQHFPAPYRLRAKRGQILLLVTSSADAGRTTAAKRQGVIRFYK
jgi:hypothetical protein